MSESLRRTFQAEVPWPFDPIRLDFEGGLIVWDGSTLHVCVKAARTFAINAGDTCLLAFSRSSSMSDASGLIGRMLGRKKITDRLHVELRTPKDVVRLWAEAPGELVEDLPELAMAGAEVQLPELRYLLHVLRAIGAQLPTAPSRPPPPSRLPAPEPVLPPPRRPLEEEVAAHWTVLAMACMVYADGKVKDDELTSAFEQFETNPIFSQSPASTLRKDFQETLDTLKIGSQDALDFVMGKLTEKARTISTHAHKQQALTAVLAIAQGDGHFDEAEHRMATQLKELVGASVVIPEADPSRTIACRQCGRELAFYEGYGHWCEACHVYTDPHGAAVDVEEPIDLDEEDSLVLPASEPEPEVEEEEDDVGLDIEIDEAALAEPHDAEVISRLGLPCAQCGEGTAAYDDDGVFRYWCEACQRHTEAIGTVTATIPEWAELAVRRSPSIEDNNTVGCIRAGESLPLFAELGEWLCVAYDVGAGYLSAHYVSVELNPSEEPENAAEPLTRDPIPCWGCDAHLPFYAGYGYWCQACQGYTVPIGIATVTVQPPASLLVHHQPQDDSLIIGSVDPGYDLLVLQHMEGGWLRVVVQGRIGFVSLAQVELVYSQHPPVPAVSQIPK